MTDDPQARFDRLQELYLELVELPPTERAARLEAVRAGSAALWADLVELLPEESTDEEEVTGDTVAMHEVALDRLAGGSGPPAGAREVPDRLPERIGIYRIVRLLGEGGMGRVFEAEQEDPIVRRVAVKVLRRDAASEHVLRRFETERQALAVMDHPHVSRILDAGSTADGRPYFAMELVEGEPITAWADHRDLDLTARIELFLPVCEAIQHAHLKGVIHRDLKPSNILVTTDDAGRPVPKVIDFGIAKAIDRPLLFRTLATRFGQVVGTPVYMSPEQAALGSVDVDTRSDVYTLGLVLHELLLGDLPLRLEDLHDLAFDEICRRIREEETTRPSSRLGLDRRSRTPANPGPDAAGPRGATRGWTRRVRAELDAVLLKALEKDRDRRYESAAALAGDLRRFLADEPVRAAPPGLAYRARKFVRRHRTAVLLSALAALSLVVGLVAATVGLVEARRAASRASAAESEALGALRTAEETTDFLLGLFRASDPRENPGLALDAGTLLDRGIERVARLDDEPVVQARLLETLGDVSRVLGAYDRAEPLLEQALELRSTAAPDPHQEAQTLNRLGGLYRERAELDRAAAAHRRAIAVLETAGVEDSTELGNAWNGLGIALSRARDFEAAAPALERAIELSLRLEDQPSGNTASGLANLAVVYLRAGDHPAALRTNQRAFGLFEHLLPAGHPNFAVLHANRSNSSRALGDLGAALASAEQALAIDRAALPAGHPGIASDLHALGSTLWRLGELDAARRAFEEGLSILAETLGPENLETAPHRASMGSVALAAGDPEEAIRHLDGALALTTGSDDPRAPGYALAYLLQKAAALREAGRPGAAEDVLAEAVALVSRPDLAERSGPVHLLAALVALDRGERELAERRFGQAVDAAACAPDAACELDRAEQRVLRAHWHARTGDVDAAFRTLGFAVDAPGWTAWMLELPDLEGLRESGDPRWTELAGRLGDRRRATVEISRSRSGPSDIRTAGCSGTACPSRSREPCTRPSGTGTSART